MNADDLEDLGLEPDIEQLLAGEERIEDRVPLAETLTAYRELTLAEIASTSVVEDRMALEQFAVILECLASLADGTCGDPIDAEFRDNFVQALSERKWSLLTFTAAQLARGAEHGSLSVPGWMECVPRDVIAVAEEYRYSARREGADWLGFVREMPGLVVVGNTSAGKAVDAAVQLVRNKVLPALVREYGLVPRPVQRSLQ